MIETFASRVLRIAQEKSISLLALRDLTGIPLGRFNAITRGLAPPHEAEIIKIATMLNVSPEALTGDVPDESEVRLKEVLGRIGEAHRYMELLPDFRHRRELVRYRNEKPWDERTIRAFLREKGFTDYGWRDLYDPLPPGGVPSDGPANISDGKDDSDWG